MSKNNQKGFTQHHLQCGRLGSKLEKSKSGAGFTLIEMIIYLGIVSIILVSISYLILDIMGGQIKSYAGQDVNQNLRFVVNYLIKDIKSAQDFGSPASHTLVLTMSGDDITYNFNSADNSLTRQLGAASPVNLNSDRVEVTGAFTDLSYNGRTKNVGVDLIVEYKNPNNLPDYNASTTSNFSVELRGRK